MKRIMPVLAAMACILTGCGRVVEQTSVISPGEEVTDAHDATVPAVLSDDEVWEHSLEFPEFDSISDEQALARLTSGMYNFQMIGYYYVPPCGSDCTVLVVPDGMDGNEYLASMYPNETITETGGDNVADCYLAGEKNIAVAKQFRLSGNNYAYYDGGLDEQSVIANFDLLANGENILYRTYRDDPEIKCIIYDFYAVRSNGDGTAELGWYSYLIDRDDHLVNLTPEWNRMRTVSFPEDADDTPVPEGVMMDVELTLDPKELVLGQDAGRVFVRAVPDASNSPETVELIDADTDEVVLTLYDDNDYNAHGDNIQGDGWYCNFYTVEDFSTDPDVSEERQFRFYAQFEADGVLHRSDTAELFVTEPFTDKELADRERVDNAVSELMQSEEWQNADTKSRRALACELLRGLADEGLVTFDEKAAMEDDYDTVSYEYTSGGLGGIGVEDRDPLLN